MMKDFKDCLIGFIYVLMAVFLAISVFWSYQTGRVYHHKQTNKPMIPTLTAADTKLYLPFKVKPDEEEFRLGEIYIDKQGYLRQQKGE